MVTIIRTNFVPFDIPRDVTVNRTEALHVTSSKIVRLKTPLYFRNQWPDEIISRWKVQISANLDRQSSTFLVCFLKKSMFFYSHPPFVVELSKHHVCLSQEPRWCRPLLGQRGLRWQTVGQANQISSSLEIETKIWIFFERKVNIVKDTSIQITCTKSTFTKPLFFVMSFQN